MENQPTPKTKPTWLQILEAESWQAEMIISGAAIYGTLQLPALVTDLSHYALLHLAAGYQLPMYFIIWYLILAVTVLIVNFIAHFILRALWIGMVGVASVFPNGINADSTFYSRHFLEQLRNDFPDLSGFNQRLDEGCSLIFGFSFALVLIFLVFTSWLAVGLLLTAILRLVAPGADVLLFFLLFLTLIILPSLLSSVLNTKAFRDREWVQKFHYPLLARRYGRIFYHVFHDPLMYLLNTFMTNIQRSKFGLVGFLYFLVVILLSTHLLLRSNAVLLFGDSFFELDQRGDRLYADNYENELAEGAYVIRPLLPSREINGPLLPLFLPQAERESDAVETLCGAYEPDPQLVEAENRQRRRALRLECMKRYYTIYLDQQLLPDLSYHFYNHSRHGEPGVLTYLPIDSLPAGEHHLRIVYQFANEEGKKKESILPFWVVRE